MVSGDSFSRVYVMRPPWEGGTIRQAARFQVRSVLNYTFQTLSRKLGAQPCPPGAQPRARRSDVRPVRTSTYARPRSLTFACMSSSASRLPHARLLPHVRLLLRACLPAPAHLPGHPLACLCPCHAHARPCPSRSSSERAACAPERPSKDPTESSDCLILLRLFPRIPRLGITFPT
ncbi:hypothetical protein CRG98_035926 [Punica granatum]|uniref:Uncharacterized protein n=1 Tax=Punica granatum TaxID=22663 RepID=A0A2I0II49_PUNGR|nr:hypothetical protein CRG98_035926 [Punica granatum]